MTETYGVRFERRGLVLISGERVPEVCADRILVELRDLRTPGMLSTRDALALSGALRRFEHAYDERHGWRRPPEVFVIRRTCDMYALAKLHIPNRAWRRRDGAVGVLTRLGGLAGALPNAARSLIDGDVTRAPLIGAAMIAEGWQIVNDTADFTREIRMLHAVDVDGRVYQVTRCKCCDRTTYAILTPREYADVRCRFDLVHPGESMRTVGVVGALTALAQSLRNREVGR